MFNKIKRKILELEFRNKSLELRLEKQKEFIPKFVMFFNNLMSSHDDSLATSKHIERVADMVKTALMVFPKEQIIPNIPNYDYQVFCDSVYVGAFLHDLGKFHISNSIISKPNKLNDDEFELIKKHPKWGSVDAIDLPLDEEYYNKVIVNNIILHHHSNIDGSGYPDGLSGNEIPYEARFVAIFDRLEALMAKRSYKDSKTLDESLAILEREKKVDNNILDMVKEYRNVFKKYQP